MNDKVYMKVSTNIQSNWNKLSSINTTIGQDSLKLPKVQNSSPTIPGLDHLESSTITKNSQDCHRKSPHTGDVFLSNCALQPGPARGRVHPGQAEGAVRQGGDRSPKSSHWYLLLHADVGGSLRRQSIKITMQLLKLANLQRGQKTGCFLFLSLCRMLLLLPGS